MNKGERIRMNGLYFVKFWLDCEMTSSGSYEKILFVPTQKGRSADEYIGYALGYYESVRHVRRGHMSNFDGTVSEQTELLWSALTNMHQRLMSIAEQDRKAKRAEWEAKQKAASAS